MVDKQTAKDWISLLFSAVANMVCSHLHEHSSQAWKLLLFLHQLAFTPTKKR